jgi:glycosyltransferase involved in cell wall biosynthesis
MKLSLNIFGTSHMRTAIRKASCIHMHWVNNESLRIDDFPLLSGKAVITLHDEWFYCGAEHYAYGDRLFQRVVDGYSKSNQVGKGIDISRWIWLKKVEAYRKLHQVIFTVPSSWMQARAQQSFLLKNMDIRVIPNPINMEVFTRKSERTWRAHFSDDSFVIAFGAINGTASRQKGFDLLEKALQALLIKRIDATRIKLLVFGGKTKSQEMLLGYECIHLGHISNMDELAMVYSSADITLVPSRVESFGQVAAESMSCQTPVVAFRCSGLVDIVSHLDSGYLADPFDVNDLAQGIAWFMDMDQESRAHIGTNARLRIKQKFCQDIVRNQFLSIYAELEKSNIDYR